MEMDVCWKEYLRDMIRRVAFGVNFAIIGFENQEIMELTECSATLIWEIRKSMNCAR